MILEFLYGLLYDVPTSERLLSFKINPVDPCDMLSLCLANKDLTLDLHQLYLYCPDLFYDTGTGTSCIPCFDLFKSCYKCKHSV